MKRYTSQNYYKKKIDITDTKNRFHEIKQKFTTRLP